MPPAPPAPPPVPAFPPRPPVALQPGPAGQGQAVSLAQLQIRVPVAVGGWQTQYPTFIKPVESRYTPPGKPPWLLQRTQWSAAHVPDAIGVPPAEQAVFAADGIA